MSRYIKYDALDYKNWHMIGKSSDFIDGVVYMAERIEEAPSIDIVRCKECKHYVGCHCESEEMWESIYGEIAGCEYMVREPDDFCSYGERREP